MRPCLRRWARGIFLITAGCCFGASGSAGETPGLVSVTLQSGRRLTGHVEPQTNESILHLGTASPNIRLTSHVDWRQVVSIRDADRTWSPRELCLWARLQRTGAEFGAPQDEPGPVQQTAGERDAAQDGYVPAAGIGPLAEFPPSFLRPIPLRMELPPPVLIPVEVRSLDIDVRAARWESRLAEDGLEVRLFPRTADGMLVPAEGSARVRLIARRVTSGRQRIRQSTDPLFPEIGQWLTPVRRWDFRDWGATYHLPWQRVDPTTDRTLSGDAQVVVDFGVRGGRTFHATAPVTLRTLSPLQQEWQSLGGVELVPLERP